MKNVYVYLSLPEGVLEMFSEKITDETVTLDTWGVAWGPPNTGFRVQRVLGRDLFRLCSVMKLTGGNHAI